MEGNLLEKAHGSALTSPVGADFKTVFSPNAQISTLLEFEVGH